MRDTTKNLIIQGCFVLFVLIIWQTVYFAEVFPQLIFPSLEQIGSALIKSFKSDNIASMLGHSMVLIVEGLFIGIAASFVLSSFSIMYKPFYAIYNMIVSICDLLPGVALLPLAILWIGISDKTILALVIHSVVWPMSRNIIEGFKSIPKLYLEAGMNIGLSGMPLVLGVYIPASFSYILSGLKVGWARAWRGLISAEMIFGVTSSGAGIGWYIYMKRNYMDTPGMFAALIVIIIIGLIIEYGIFTPIEKMTVRKWGMRL